LGPSAEGPGQYALGRGYLAMRDYGKALEALERAWGLNYRPSEAALSLAQIHLVLGNPTRFKVGGALEGGQKGQNEVETAKFHREQALTFFHLSDRQGMEASPYSRAQIAYLENDWKKCRAFSEQVVQEQPWRYEALLLNAMALERNLYEKRNYQGHSAEIIRPLLQEAERVLSRAADLGRSDGEVQMMLCQITNELAMLESESGHPSLDPLLHARSTLEKALLIYPHDELLSTLLGTMDREILLRLAAGEDTRDLCRQGIKLAAEGFAMTPKSIGTIRGQFGILHWLYGESLWRRGVDPRAFLETTLSAIPKAEMEQAEALNVLSRYEGQHGQDIRQHIHRAEGILEQLIRERGEYFYLRTIWGESMAVLAHWEYWTERDPVGAIRRGRAQLEKAIKIQPEVVYSYFHLPLLHAMEARLALAQGQNPAPSVAAALQAARAGAAIRANHFRTQLALAEAHHVAALADIQAHRDPMAHLTLARKAVRDAWALNGTDWRIALAESRLALTEAELDQAVG
ncbi:MAG: hypothetical protein WAT51_14035, partial [Holophaga sp.]